MPRDTASVSSAETPSHPYLSPTSSRSQRGQKRSKAPSGPSVRGSSKPPLRKARRMSSNSETSPSGHGMGRGSPRQRARRSPSLDQDGDDSSEFSGTAVSIDSPQLLVTMEEERQLFPGSKNWAEDEDKLFQILYMRDKRPLLPNHWEVDFRGIPVPRFLFKSSDEYPATIYSRCGHDFKATKALIQLIQLTSTVRSLIQTGQKDKVSSTIRRELEEYVKWAAQDGGYDNLDIVPNLIVDAVDISSGGERIEQYMQSSMKSLAAKHRKYWRIERLAEDEVWDLPIARKRSPSIEIKNKELDPEEIDLPSTGSPRHSPRSAKGKSNGAHPTIKAKSSDEEPPRLEFRYTQRPPTLYGIFVVHHSVLVLSVDSSKENDEAYVSYQVEAGFDVKYQGVWNAITIALVICLARDHMITMANDFVQLVGSPDSDPDA